MTASTRLHKGTILILLSTAIACQKEREKIVYVEVPVEKQVPVEVEKVNEVQVPGETITKTVEKEVQVPVLADSVDSAVVALSPGTLALSNGVSLIPPKTEGSVQARPALRGLRLLDFAAATSEYDSFEEDIVIWNPAQEPLKNVNNFLCIITKTAYNKAAAENSAARLTADKDAAVEVDTVYIAKVTVSECGSRDSMGTAAGGSGGGAKAKKAPVDITVKLYKEKNKPLLVSLWYTVKISDLLNNGTETGMQGMAGSGDSSEDARNYYLHLRVAEPVSQENPFGLFDLEWDSYDVKGGNEQTAKSVNGFIRIYRKSVTNDLMLNYYDNSLMPNPWNSDWANYIKNQAIAQLDVKALMNDNKEVTGYEIKGGDAHTAINYSWNYVGGDPNYQGSSGGSDSSGSYSLAFDSDYIMTKYNMGPDHYMRTYNWSGFDPEAATCSTRNENWVNVWEYALFAPDGSRISQPNGYMIKTGKIHPEWKYPITGWFSRWGMWVEGVSQGETVHLVDWESGTETPFIYTELNGRLMNRDWMDVTASQAANLTLTCNSNCPKAPITQDDINNNTVFLNSGGPYTYNFDATTKKMSYGGQEVKFAAGVSAAGTSFEWAWTAVDAEMTDAGGNQFRYQMSLNNYNKPSALRIKNSDGSAGSFFVIPDPIQFEPFTYIDAQHAYAHNGNPGAEGKQFLFTYDGYLTGINWEQKTGRKDQWNNDMWAPEIILKRGVELTAANSTGKVKAGDKIKVAPKVSQHTAKSRNFLNTGDIGVTKDGCSMSLQERLAWIKHDMNLPVEKADQDTKKLIGGRPLAADGAEPPVLYSDGEPLKK